MEPSAHGRSAIRRRQLGWVLLTGIIGVALLAVALWVCLSVLPSRLYPSLVGRDLAGLTPGERAERIEGQRRLQNDARTTALQGLAALLVLVGAGIGAAVTLRQVGTSREQLAVTRQQVQAAAQQAREQLDIAQQGQITERYTRAIDQLGRDQVDVRIGGIYALERIARDSPSDRITIGDVLTAFIRGHAPWPPSLPGQYIATADISAMPELPVRAPDVQASLTVLGRGGFAPPQGESDRLDLSAVDLRGAHLHDFHLERAWLDRAHLEMADLAGAHLEGAELPAANLERANLVGAHLEEADLTYAQLEQATLRDVHMDGATLAGANLRWAFLVRAHLDRANLEDARLQRAILGEAHLEGAILAEAHLDGANLEDARLDRANLAGAHLEGAILTGARLDGADLAGAHLEGANLARAHLEGSLADMHTNWPPGFDWRAAGVSVKGEDRPPCPP